MNPQKHRNYQKVCSVIGQPALEFADRIRQVVGFNAGADAHLVAYNKHTNMSYQISVTAAVAGGSGCGGEGDGGEYLMTLAEEHGGSAADGSPANGKLIFKGRVQMPPAAAAARGQGRRRPGEDASEDTDGGGAGGAGGAGSRGDRRQRRSSRKETGLSNIAGVCMLCAVASIGGAAFYGSYMSQVSDAGTIIVHSAEIHDLKEGVGGTFLSLDILATHTSCVLLKSKFTEGLSRHTADGAYVLYNEGDACDGRARHLIAPSGVQVAYTSTGVRLTLTQMAVGAGLPDREWFALEILADDASIIHLVRVTDMRW